MFELLNAYETAKSEKNKLLRFVLIEYVQNKLKKSFFRKFDIYNKDMKITEELLLEFNQFYNCVNEYLVHNSRINIKYPNILSINTNGVLVNYYQYHISLKIIDNDYYIEIRDTIDSNDTTSSYHGPSLDNYIREIILMAIYNYCVSYIYGYNSNMYIEDNKYINIYKY